jgi:hypothetical protein
MKYILYWNCRNELFANLEASLWPTHQRHKESNQWTNPWPHKTWIAVKRCRHQQNVPNVYQTLRNKAHIYTRHRNKLHTASNYKYPYYLNNFTTHTSQAQRSRYNDWLQAGRRRGRSSSPGMVKNFLFFTSNTPALGSTQPFVQWVPEAFFPGVKRQGREAEH